MEEMSLAEMQSSVGLGIFHLLCIFAAFAGAWKLLELLGREFPALRITNSFLIVLCFIVAMVPIFAAAWWGIPWALYAIYVLQ